MKEAKKEAAEAKLLEHYQEICEKYPELGTAAETDWTKETYPAGDITLITTGLRRQSTSRSCSTPWKS